MEHKIPYYEYNDNKEVINIILKEVNKYRRILKNLKIHLHWIIKSDIIYLRRILNERID